LTSQVRPKGDGKTETKREEEPESGTETG
jgi:hypothetical protein